MSKIVLAISFLFLSACASIHSGKSAKTVDGEGSGKKESKLGLVISGSEIKDLSSQYFDALDFTFENKTNKWITVKNVTIDFIDPLANEKI